MGRLLIVVMCMFGALCMAVADEAKEKAFDPLQEILDAALATYHEVEDEVLRELGAVIQQQFEAATKKGDFDTAKKHEEARKALEENGIFPSAPVFHGARSKAEKRLQRADEKLSATFDSVIKAHTQNKDLAAAEAVRKEKARLLPEGIKPRSVGKRTPGLPKGDAANSFINSVGMAFLRIPQGEFVMGSPPDEIDRFHKVEDQVDVKLSKTFFMSRSVVTQAQWQAVMRTSPWQPHRMRIGALYPATHISWHDAQRFCAVLTDAERKSGKLSPQSKYALPSEAQWEYACRAGTKSRFSFGDDVAGLSEYAWWGADIGGSAQGEGYPHEVGRKKPNGFGLYDMHGNVWQWCSNWLSDDLSSGVDPTGPDSGTIKVIRGGCFYGPVRFLRCAMRGQAKPDLAANHIGCRVVFIPGE